MVLDIVCNYKKCRKSLSVTAWVTSCSHAFCEDHGDFAKNVHDIIQCPACSTQLNDKFDVVQADLNPPESFRSIVLAGMKPDVVMDIAMRAISFWSYQMNEETKYQESIGKHAHEKAKKLEEIHSSSLQRAKIEMQSSKKKIEELQQEFNKQKRQTEEYAAIIEERNRKIQKMQYQLDAQRRNSVHINEIEVNESQSRQNVGNIVVNRFKSPGVATTKPEKFTFQPHTINQNQYANQKDNSTQLFHNPGRFVFNPVTRNT